jgi:competence ComEA-like helix-hairpin-helix protein
MPMKRRIYTLMAATVVLGSAMGGHVYAAVPTQAQAPVASDAVKVSLNKGDAKALMQIKGMSAYKAHAIVAYRNKNGSFKNASELDQVKGFKRMTPEGMKALTEHLVID